MKRQGDLLIICVDGVPAGARGRDSRVLAEGEATGHLHELTAGEVYEKHGALFFKVGHGMEVELTHPEHDTLVFTPGTYKVIRQREYEPEGWRYVSD